MRVEAPQADSGTIVTYGARSHISCYLGDLTAILPTCAVHARRGVMRYDRPPGCGGWLGVLHCMGAGQTRAAHRAAQLARLTDGDRFGALRHWSLLPVAQLPHEHCLQQRSHAVRMQAPLCDLTLAYIVISSRFQPSQLLCCSASRRLCFSTVRCGEMKTLGCLSAFSPHRRRRHRRRGRPASELQQKPRSAPVRPAAAPNMSPAIGGCAWCAPAGNTFCRDLPPPQKLACHKLMPLRLLRSSSSRCGPTPDHTGLLM